MNDGCVTYSTFATRPAAAASLITTSRAAPSAVFHTFRSKLASGRRFLQPFQIRANEHETPGRPRPPARARPVADLIGAARLGRPMLIVVNARPPHLRIITLARQS